LLAAATSATRTDAPARAPSPPRIAAAPAPASRLYALDVGPFVSAAEAEAVERRLGAAGYPAARIRRDADGALYEVRIEKVASPRDAEALIASLREQNVGEAAAVGAGETLAVRVGGPVALRDAVRVGERLHALGHRARIATHAGTFVVRHGSYLSREEADETGDALRRLGIAARIVEVR
jgi:cell division protein FtsN